MAFLIPAKPTTFTPQATAPGCERIPNLYERALLTRPVDVLVVHTNWAPGEGTIESARRWSLANPGTNTYPHYQHDRNGRAAKMLDTNRRGIGTAGTTAYWEQWDLPNASWRTLTFETADRGTNTDPVPEGSYFTEAQMAALARDLAYECVVHRIPPVLLPHPTKRGIAGHCFPFGYPVFTTANGKQCPGHRKYRQLVETVIPWTADIVQAWTGKVDKPEPPPPPPAPTPTPPPSGGSYVVNANRTTVRLGSTGKMVKRAQFACQLLSGKPSVVDGDFGPMTDRAIRDLQAFLGAYVDGVVGPQTWGILEGIT